MHAGAQRTLSRSASTMQLLPWLLLLLRLIESSLSRVPNSEVGICSRWATTACAFSS
jgi:hypothetical protein